MLSMFSVSLRVEEFEGQKAAVSVLPVSVYNTVASF